ncbi:hypothetical protein R3P38DRAFT_3129772 [Favolaschia claudopus]|uniref:F-box domain-containing protein n=1 Tax=Favolaschia claudopus TaxID=2862362 RepID=A0AAV9Z961_9AGAR
MAAPGLPFPELWDHIIGFIPPVPSLTPTLKHLALVCRTFASAAQRSLFRSISIEDGRRIVIEPEMVVDRSAITGPIVAGHLADVLASSPHLLPFIRELTVKSEHTECYRILSEIPWVNLRSLHFKDLLRIPSSARGAVETLISMPSLRRLEISTYSGTVPNTPTAQWMQWMLSSCSPHLEFLVLEGVYMDSAELSQGTTNHTASNRRPRLCELSLTHCNGISGLLLHAFDFSTSSLRMVQCIDTHGPDVVLFMRQIGSSVEHLVVSSQDRGHVNEQLDLAVTFPALTTISSPTPPGIPGENLTFGPAGAIVANAISPVSTFNTMLRSASADNKITRIVFEAEVGFFLFADYNSWFERPIAEFEEIAASHLHALQVVEVHVEPQPRVHGYQPYETVEESVHKAFPKLHQKGLLAVSLLSPTHDHEYEYY